MLWRIVRVNGDGTIRLVLNNPIADGVYFSSTTHGAKYVGYTYDNAHVCTLSNPCFKNDYRVSFS